MFGGMGRGRDSRIWVIRGGYRGDIVFGGIWTGGEVDIGFG